MGVAAAGSLRDRRVLVTGGGRGLGRAIALACARHGARVAVVARSEADVDQVAREAGRLGVEAFPVVCDLADAAAIEATVDHIERSFGAIDALVNNAATIDPLGSTLASDPDAWQTTIALNLLGPYRLIRRLAPGMVARRWGRIVNVSSSAALGAGMPGGSAYSVSKAALDMLTRSLAAELSASGVLVFGIHPGPLNTGMQAELRGAEAALGRAAVARFHHLYAAGALADPQGPADLVVALCAARSDEYHGRILEYHPEPRSSAVDGDGCRTAS